MFGITMGESKNGYCGTFLMGDTEIADNTSVLQLTSCLESRVSVEGNQGYERSFCNVTTMTILK